jgi:ATP-dependent RNA helicase DDX20
MDRTLDVLGDAPSFADLLLPTATVHALRAAGFLRPSPVQQAAIPLARLGADLIVQAKAGTGKTLVFAVAAAERVDGANCLPQVLILTPTREVALQAADVLDTATSGGAVPLAVATLIGGLPRAEDERVLRRTCHIVVGTPGRVLALLQRGALVARELRMLVLDEADRLLGEGLHDEVEAVVAELPPRRQVLALSATYTPAALAELRAMMRQPQEVRLCEETVALLGLHQFYRIAGVDSGVGRGSTSGRAAGEALKGEPGFKNKLAALLDVLRDVSFHQTVVFCNRKSTAETLADALAAAGHAAGCLSADRAQRERIAVVNALRALRLRIVVSTDVAARGVDLDRVNLVVCFDPTADPATHMHRVGRAGRFGTRGVAVSLLRGGGELAQLRAMLQEAGGGEVRDPPLG